MPLVTRGLPRCLKRDAGQRLSFLAGLGLAHAQEFIAGPANRKSQDLPVPGAVSLGVLLCGDTVYPVAVLEDFLKRLHRCHPQVRRAGVPQARLAACGTRTLGALEPLGSRALPARNRCTLPPR